MPPEEGHASQKNCDRNHTSQVFTGLY